jgi:glutathione S-transferase
MTRFALNIKKIPYKTMWIEFPDIHALYQELGIAASTFGADGKPVYTLPVIRDLEADSIISESFKIVRYLDSKFPSSIPLVPDAAAGLQLAFRDLFTDTIMAVYPPMVPMVIRALSPRSVDFYRSSREAAFGKLFENICPPGLKREEAWGRGESSFGRLVPYFDAESTGPFIMGSRVSFADLQIAACLMWLIQLAPDEWKKRVAKWHGGRWVRFMEAFDQWKSVDDGQLHIPKF